MNAELYLSSHVRRALDFNSGIAEWRLSPMGAANNGLAPGE